MCNIPQILVFFESKSGLEIDKVDVCGVVFGRYGIRLYKTFLVTMFICWQQRL